MKKTILLLIFLTSASIVYSDQQKKEETMNKIPENLKALLELSLRAPSSHNAQMWEIKYKGSMTIEIYIDDKRLLKEVDPENREACISIGALIENIISAAPEFALSAELGKSGEPDSAAEIHFMPTQKNQDNKISDLINKRCTIRGKHKKEALKEDDISNIIAVSSSHINYYPKSSDSGDKIYKAALQAAVIQTNDDKKQKELSGWMRFSKKERNNKKDGITPEMMGFKGIVKEFIYLIFNDKTAMEKSFRNKTESVFKEQLDNCAGFFVISSENQSAENLISTGRILQRMWLKCAEKNIAIHPMSQAVEEKLISPENNLTGMSDKNIQLILRTGYIDKYPDPASRRKSIDDVLIYE